MFITKKKLHLASASPRRQGFLEILGINYHKTVVDIDERPQGEEAPLDYVKRIAQLKYTAAAENHQSDWILAADTIVYRDKVIFGKPGSPDEAVRILLLLSDKKHHVATTFCLGCKNNNSFHCQTVISEVEFINVTKEAALAYVNTGEPLDKAGAYGIQGIGAMFVKRLQGSYTNVVGLPLSEVVSVLCHHGIVQQNINIIEKKSNK